MTESNCIHGTRAFVAGATGYVGGYAVRELLAAGVETVAHIRPDSRQLDTQRAAFETLGAQVDTTAWDETAMAQTFARLSPTHVFILIGTTRARMRDYKQQGRDPHSADYEAIDYGLTALLVAAAKRAGSTPRLVYLSAMGAGPKAKGAYMQARSRAERAVTDSGLPYIVVRPAIITGPDRSESRPAELWGGRILDGLLATARAIGIRSANNYRSISGNALAKAMVRAALNPTPESRILERRELG